jgi:hypothetical protein
MLLLDRKLPDFFFIRRDLIGVMYEPNILNIASLRVLSASEVTLRSLSLALAAFCIAPGDADRTTFDPWQSILIRSAGEATSASARGEMLRSANANELIMPYPYSWLVYQ